MSLTFDSAPESLVNISNDILGILQADAEPHQIVGHTEGDPLLLLDGGVRHQVGELGQTLVPAEWLRQSDDLDVVCERTEESVKITLRAERKFLLSCSPPLM